MNVLPLFYFFNESRCLLIEVYKKELTKILN